jgi:arsenate reductase (thioredoxin)
MINEATIAELRSPPKPAVRDNAPAATDYYNVLFVCRDNSACSIVAEAIMKRWGRREFRAFSAGIRPANEVNPVTVEVLKSRNLWGRSTQTKGCAEFLKRDAERMNFIISIGEERLICLPTGWPGNPSIIHWRINEPIFDGEPAKIALAFRRTFGELENRIKLFIVIYERERAKKAAAIRTIKAEAFELTSADR